MRGSRDVEMRPEGDATRRGCRSESRGKAQTRKSVIVGDLVLRGWREVATQELRRSHRLHRNAAHVRQATYKWRAEDENIRSFAVGFGCSDVPALIV